MKIIWNMTIVVISILEWHYIKFFVCVDRCINVNELCAGSLIITYYYQSTRLKYTFKRYGGVNCRPHLQYDLQWWFGAISFELVLNITLRNLRREPILRLPIRFFFYIYQISVIVIIIRARVHLVNDVLNIKCNNFMLYTNYIIYFIPWVTIYRLTECGLRIGTEIYEDVIDNRYTACHIFWSLK